MESQAVDEWFEWSHRQAAPTGPRRSSSQDEIGIGRSSARLDDEGVERCLLCLNVDTLGSTSSR